MLSSKLQDRVNSTLSSVAVSQMLLDKFKTTFKNLIKINRVENYFPNGISITSSLSLTLNLMEMLGATYDTVIEIITAYLTEKYGKNIREMDRVVRYALMTALNLMVSCANSPIIGDDYIYETDNKGKRSGDAKYPIYINLQSVDLFNLFKTAPTQDHGDYYYGDIPDSMDLKVPSNMWKSGDLDAFIWYVINKVEEYGEANEKCVWDNRNLKFKSQLEEEEIPEGGDEYYIGGEAEDFWKGVEDDGDLSEERKQLFYLAYNSGENMLRIELNDKTYGEKNIFTIPIAKEGETTDPIKYSRNRTIYEFNKDYMESIRIFYVKPVVASIMNALLNNSIPVSIGGSLTPTLEEEIIQGEISRVLQKMAEADDTEIEDCYFNFSNEEYDSIIREADLRRRGITVSKGDINAGEVMSPEEAMEILDGISGSATLQEQKTVIKNVFNVIVAATGSTDPNVKNTLNWNADTFANKVLGLFENIVKKLMSAVLTPRVILIFLINYKFANGVLPRTPLDFLSAFVKLLWPAIRMVLEFIIGILLDWVEARIKELFAAFILEITLESLEKIKTVMLALLDSCTLNINIPYNRELIGNIDNVIGADILEGEIKTKPNGEYC